MGHRAAAAQHPAQLPDRGAHAVHLGGHGARSCTSTSSRATRTAGRSTATPARSSTSGRRASRDTKPFGTEQDVYAAGYTFLKHSIATRPVAEDPCSDLRITVGGAAVHAAVLAVGAQHLGDELRRARRQRRARDEHRREGGQLRPRHRRGRASPATTAAAAAT